MKIKTVWNSMGASNLFDEKVNALLAEGWKLARREVLPGAGFTGPVYDNMVVYAELVKLDEADMEPQEADPATWQEAVEVLRETCGTAAKCEAGGCPMWAWCQKHLATPPANWLEPAE